MILTPGPRSPALEVQRVFPRAWRLQSAIVAWDRAWARGWVDALWEGVWLTEGWV